MFRYLTAGESHGKCLTVIIEGMPAGVTLTTAFIDTELTRRQSGYGRGDRMKIERDRVEILSGVRGRKTLGGPISLLIPNRDWENWQNIMACGEAVVEEEDIFTNPRPGHADLAGGLKYGQKDLRNILERASARETAVRVATGAVAKTLLGEFNIRIISDIVEIGGVKAKREYWELEKICERKKTSSLGCSDRMAERLMIAEIKRAGERGDTLGGIFEVMVDNVPVGLGSHVHWDRKLDGRLARALMSIQAIKGVEVGLGFETARKRGSWVHDEIFYRKPGKGEVLPAGGFYRKTNNAGGIEGGMSNGETIVLRAAMKPIATLRKSLRSVDIETKKMRRAAVERSDVCAVPAAAVVGEAVVAIEIARAMQEKFGGDNLAEMHRNYRSYLEQLAEV